MPDLEQLARASVDPATPPVERHDINAELFEIFKGEVGRGLVDEIREDVERWGSMDLAKSFSLEPFTKQQKWLGDKRRHASILTVNEMGLIDTGDEKSRWLERRYGSGFEFLRHVGGTDLITAVKLTRARQIRSFGKPERDLSPLGWHILRNDGEEITDRDKEAVRRIESFVLNCGDIDDYFKRKRYRRPDLDTFLAALVDDTLTGDACPVEIAYTAGKKPSGLYNLPFDTIRLCSESGYEGDDEIFAVQLHEGLPRLAYSYEDLIYEVRNPRTDIFSGGYGLAEPEVVVRALTGYLNAYTFNASGIDRSAIPRGVLTLIGEYDPNQLASFKKQMQSMLKGAGNRHNVPVLTAAKDKGGGGGAMWTPMDQFNEMFFARFIMLNVAIVCAVYGIDPSEIHFDSFNLRSSSLAGNDTEEKLTMSRDKGLVPLLAFVEKILNIVVQLLDRRYRFEFVGLHAEDEDKKFERIKLASTLDELRAMDGLDPHPDKDMGGAPAGNPNLMGLYGQKVMMAHGVDPGATGEPGVGASADEDEEDGGDYPRDRDGKHAPYRDSPAGPPDGDHLHTLGLGDEGDGKRKGKDVRKSTDEFLVVIEREAA